MFAAFKESLAAKILATIVRVYVGWNFLQPGIQKTFGPGAAVWTGDKAGTAVTGFLQGALQKTGGAHPDVQWLYADFIRNIALPNAKIFSYLVAWGEVVVGIALIVGCFTTVAILAAALMNFNYLFAGTVSLNPLLVLLEMTLMWVGPAAYYFAVDRLIELRVKKTLAPRPGTSTV